MRYAPSMEDSGLVSHKLAKGVKLWDGRRKASRPDEENGGQQINAVSESLEVDWLMMVDVM